VSERLDGLTHRDADWAGLRVAVTGIGVSGFAAADALVERGARVVLLDGRDGPREQERGKVLDVLGVDVRLGEEHIGVGVGGGVKSFLLPDVGGAPADVVVTSPGWRPDQPVLAAAAAAGVPVWGEVELAWRMRPAVNPAPWLTVTGTNGKTTTTSMLGAMLRAAGKRAVEAGNIGTPLLEAVLHPEPPEVLAVELSSFQLHWASSLRPLAAACLNVAPDHLDWHGGLAGYTADKGRIYHDAEIACVYNVADPVTEQLVREADVVEGCRAIGFTLGIPGLSMLGVVEDVLCDRAFIPERATSAAELGTLDDVREAGGGTLAPHNVANALAAAALARAYGVPPVAVREGLRRHRPHGHRIARVAEAAGVTWVDDSKATNPHAAAASLASFEHVVWVAGGLAKGATFDDLVAAHGGRLRAAVLIGRDRQLIADALSRHAPDVPVVEVPMTETDEVDGAAGEARVAAVMDAVVARAADHARPGDTVLLAPACASMDMFRDYHARGDAFAAAVRRFTGPDA
jgi:UDP-N-acetylmuramoylalanine--D-glutamate ligase